MVVREANGRQEVIEEMRCFAEGRGARTLALCGSEGRAVLIKVGLSGQPFIELNGGEPDPLPDLLMRSAPFFEAGRIMDGIREVIRGKTARLRIGDHVVLLRNNEGQIEAYARRPGRGVLGHASLGHPDAG